jgi:prepilin-type N-terminal cleavage/methylation domain-containing protein
MMRDSRGFSLIELIIAILIIGVIAALGGSMLIFTVQHAMYTPNKLTTDFLVSNAMDMIVDGNSSAKGLRFARQITAVAANSVTYIDQDGKTVVVTLNTGTNQLTRTINGSPDNNFLRYQSGTGISIVVGRNSALFIYYDVNGNITATPANVRMVEINAIARTGSGSFGSWQGQSEFSTAVYVPKYQ